MEEKREEESVREESVHPQHSQACQISVGSARTKTNMSANVHSRETDLHKKRETHTHSNDRHTQTRHTHTNVRRTHKNEMPHAQ